MANEHLTLTSLLYDIADAIREQTNGTSEIVADTFPTAIRNIPKAIVQSSKTVSASTSEQIVTPDNGYDALGQVVVNALNHQSKTVTPSTSEQIITPDSGYDALGQVVVNALKYQSKTVTPSTSKQTITPSSGYDALSQVVVNAISGKVIKTGTHTPSSAINNFTITHSLGVLPDFCLCLYDNLVANANSYIDNAYTNLANYNPILGYINGHGFYVWAGSSASIYMRTYDYTKSWSTLYGELSYDMSQTIFPTCVSSVTTSKITFGHGDESTYNHGFGSGRTYRWIVGKIY